MTMPYIITTRPHPAVAPDPEDPGYGMSVTRTAVATLDEARGWLWNFYAEWKDAHADQVPWADEIDVPESGGTVGPLPDGTVIEVEHVTLPTLHARVVNSGHPLSEGLLHAPERLTIAAFNGAQA